MDNSVKKRVVFGSKLLFKKSKMKSKKIEGITKGEIIRKYRNLGVSMSDLARADNTSRQNIESLYSGGVNRESFDEVRKKKIKAGKNLGTRWSRTFYCRNCGKPLKKTSLIFCDNNCAKEARCRNQSKTLVCNNCRRKFHPFYNFYMPSGASKRYQHHYCSTLCNIAYQTFLRRFKNDLKKFKEKIKKGKQN